MVNSMDSSECESNVSGDFDDVDFSDPNDYAQVYNHRLEIHRIRLLLSILEKRLSPRNKSVLNLMRGCVPSLNPKHTSAYKVIYVRTRPVTPKVGLDSPKSRCFPKSKCVLI